MLHQASSCRKTGPLLPRALSDSTLTALCLSTQHAAPAQSSIHTVLSQASERWSEAWLDEGSEDQAEKDEPSRRKLVW